MTSREHLEFFKQFYFNNLTQRYCYNKINSINSFIKVCTNQVSSFQWVSSNEPMNVINALYMTNVSDHMFQIIEKKKSS